jgi:hypothetical protein
MALAAHGLISPRDAVTFRAVRPDHGGRLQLKLEDATEARAHYTLSLSTAESEVSALVTIDVPTDRFELAAWQGGPPPGWLETYAHALLRSVLRTKSSDGDWPRRLTRWRPGPKP